MLLWSILTVTLEDRILQFSKLKDKIENQIKDCNAGSDIEYIYLSDNYKYPVGYKRNQLIAAADGEYVSFVDDDDEISDDYVSSVYNILKDQKPDCIGIRGIITFDGKYPKEFVHSRMYTTYYEDDTAYYRPPNHINIIRKDIVSKYPFAAISRGEDADIAMRMCVSKAFKTEVFLDKVIYYYNFSPTQSATHSVERT
jgi:glycosyltransferase involved in cell wall biosynthesis